jgi:hypothetical protein
MILIVLPETCWGDEIMSAWWRQDTLLSGRRGDLWLLCLLLHVLIHLCVRYHDTLHLMLKSQAPIYEIVEPKQVLLEGLSLEN